MDDEGRVASIRLPPAILAASPTLHSMIGTGWVRITQVQITRIVGGGIMWEAECTSNTVVATALPELQHPRFTMSTLDRVCAGDRVPASIDSPPFIFSLMKIRLPMEWSGTSAGRAWFTPVDQVYVHVVANDFFTGEMTKEYMGKNIVLSFVEVKLFTQRPNAK